MTPAESRLEPARPADLDQLVALDARTFARSDRFRRREWAALLGESLAEGPARILVVRLALTNAVVGAIVVAPNRITADVNIVSLSVDISYRRTGLATRLLREALSSMPAEVRTVSLEVRDDNTGARLLYEKLGFQVVGRFRRYYPDGATALEYAAPLALILERARLR
jgi:ribosomal protein S18 acetylase RimI-like enzyme